MEVQIISKEILKPSPARHLPKNLQALSYTHRPVKVSAKPLLSPEKVLTDINLILPSCRTDER